jgi:hypothetical protein
VQQSGTKLAGVDIQNGVVNLMGDRVTFSNSTGTVSGKVWIDPDNGTIHATDGKFSGEVTATGGSITGYLNVTGGLNVKNSGSSTVVQVNGSDASKKSSNDITIVDAEGFYIKRRSEGFRLTTDGFQRWNSSANNGIGGWVNFYGGRYVKFVTLNEGTTILAGLNDDFLVVVCFSNTDTFLKLPSTSVDVPNGKIYSILNLGPQAFEVNGNGRKIWGRQEYDQARINSNDRFELVYYGGKWFANYMSYLEY